jgi:hypothetical protein
MGKEVYYCTKCGGRLREEDFKQERAFSLGNRVVCAECKPLVGGTQAVSLQAPAGQTPVPEPQEAPVDRNAVTPPPGKTPVPPSLRAGTDSVRAAPKVDRSGRKTPMPASVRRAGKTSRPYMSPQPKSSNQAKLYVMIGIGVLIILAVVLVLVLTKGATPHRTGARIERPPTGRLL